MSLPWNVGIPSTIKFPRGCIAGRNAGNVHGRSKAMGEIADDMIAAEQMGVDYETYMMDLASGAIEEETILGDPKPKKKPKVLPVPDYIFKNRPTACRSCGAPMWWWKNPATGKTVPVNADSTSHFTTCTEPRKWSRK
jgi:hypothetical protein